MDRIRRCLSLVVLAAFLAGSLSWVFDAHALAGLIAAESAPEAGGVPFSDGDEHHSLPAGQDCNHGCHLTSHLVGQVCAPLQLPLPVTERPLLVSPEACPSGFLESLDRPPLALSRI
jgi:hypothetical protein